MKKRYTIGWILLLLWLGAAHLGCGSDSSSSNVDANATADTQITTDQTGPTGDTQVDTNSVPDADTPKHGETRTVGCNTSAFKPPHASSVEVDVTITFDKNFGWSSPAGCQWKCDAGYTLWNDQSCISSRQVPCTDDPNAPEQSESLTRFVTITWDDNTGWSTPTHCPWQCKPDYSPSVDDCVNSQMVACDKDNNNPPLSLDKVVLVEVTYTDKDGWTTPVKCDWECLPNYDREGDSCVNQKQVDCTDVAPQNAKSTPAKVTITYTPQDGWTTAEECVWACDPGFQDSDKNATCLADCSATTCNPAAVCNDSSGAALCLFSSCKAILDAALSTGDGIYTIDDDGAGADLPRKVYCDMTGGGVTMEFGIGQFDGGYAGWTVVTLAELSTPAFQAAFIAYYNALGGMQNLDPGYTPKNCCFKHSANPSDDSYLTLNGRAVTPAKGDIRVCKKPLDTPLLKFGIDTNITPEEPPLPADYFTTNPLSTYEACTVDANPAFFVRRQN